MRRKINIILDTNSHHLMRKCEICVLDVGSGGGVNCQLILEMVM